MSDCKHTVGYVENGIENWIAYDPPSEYEIQWMDDEYSGRWFKFCPDCGKPLDRGRERE